MKCLIYIVISLLACSCQGQPDSRNDLVLSISPAIDESNKENREVISILSKFLDTKNNSLTENEFWADTDFDKYIFPYRDIFQIEKSKYGDGYYKPTLMEIVRISEDERMLKIGFVGVNDETNETIIRAIYNIVAVKNGNEWKLKRAIDHRTRGWRQIKRGSITYALPARKTLNEDEIERQKEDIEFICDFFDTDPIDITYYSCDNPKQFFEIKGFDYLPNMYFSESGGMADFGNIVYSGNNSEYYTHEIVHIYTRKLFPDIQPILDEGIATYLGGSGRYDYSWHRERFKTYLAGSTIDLSEHLQPFEQLYVDNETPVPYMIGALICERVFRLYGKEGLIDLLRSDSELWETLNAFGMTEENLTEQLKSDIESPIYRIKM